MLIEDPMNGKTFNRIMDAVYYWCNGRLGHPERCSQCPIQTLVERYGYNCNAVCQLHTQEVLEAIGFNCRSGDMKFDQSGFDLLLNETAV